MCVPKPGAVTKWWISRQAHMQSTMKTTMVRFNAPMGSHTIMSLLTGTLFVRVTR
jgi:hypothetical protein